jgi:ribonuclease R
MFVTGRFEGDKQMGIVIPDSKIIRRDIYINGKDINGAKFGDKVLCKLINFEDQTDENAELHGKIEDVIGTAGELTTEIQSVLAKYNLIEEFPQDVIDETGKINAGEDAGKRLDYRSKNCITIDPKDAKDFDDAVSIEKLQNGNYLVGVHIADVSHYVKENTKLDEEALKRATSVYLADRVIPMLPEILSNDICSLRPGEDRLTFSVLIEITPKGIVKKYDIKKTIINSKRRFTYQEVQDIINTKKGDFQEDILLLFKLSQNLTKKRMNEGSLDFESKEVKFTFTPKGKIKEILVKDRLDSMRLIEEFMLLANKCVTEFVSKKQKEEKRYLPFIYRVHDLPDQEKLKQLSEFIKQFGYKVKLTTPVPDKESLKKLLTEVKGKPEEYVINDLLIRSMAKAIYTDKNIGHYGLGFEDYTHFTSPIRRYPDLIVHRILYDYIQNEPVSQPRINKYKRELPDMCKHCSLQEQNAVNAEREVVKIRQIEYINDHLDKKYEGIISGIIERGVFIEINDILIEGMVRFKDIKDDYYEFDQKNHRAIGRRKRKVFRAGTKVKVKVLKTNMETKKIDFTLLN